MKKSIGLILCLLWTCLSISQNLTPLERQINSKKHFCFDIEQSRFVAERLEYSLFQDSIIYALKNKNSRWFQLLKKKDVIIFKLETKVENLNVVSDNKQIEIDMLNTTIKQQNKKIKQGKLQRWFFGGGLLILTGIIIAK